MFPLVLIQILYRYILIFWQKLCFGKQQKCKLWGSMHAISHLKNPLFQQHNNLKAVKRLSTFISSWQENYFSENTYIYWWWWSIIHTSDLLNFKTDLFPL